MLTDYPDYEYGEILPFIPASARRILNVGCGIGRFGSFLDGREVYGVDPNPETPSSSTQNYFRSVYHGSFPEVVPAGANFDCIVFNEVLEKLVDPSSAVRSCLTYLAPGGCVVATITNLRYMGALKGLIFNADWTYTDAGVLDHRHLRWFTHKTGRTLFEQNGFMVDLVEPVNIETNWKARLLSLIPQLADMAALRFVVVAHPDGLTPFLPSWMSCQNPDQ